MSSEIAVRSGESTVITLFRNEENLLPFWLSHHTKIFDHGIVLNHQSTDRSAEIVRKLAPHWELIDVDIPFETNAIDRILGEHEARVDGWKMILSVTEFLPVPNVREWILEAENLHEFKKAIGLHSLIVIDPYRFHGNKLIEDENLLFQKCKGVDDKLNIRGCRYIHPFEKGDWACLGRHAIRSEKVEPHWPKICHFSYSPWPFWVKRRAAVRNRMVHSDKSVGLGHQHMLFEDQYVESWLSSLPNVYDLREFKEHGEWLEHIRARHYPDHASVREPDLLVWYGSYRYVKNVDDGLGDRVDPGSEVVFIGKWGPIGASGVWCAVKKLGDASDEIYLTREWNLIDFSGKIHR